MWNTKETGKEYIVVEEGVFEDTIIDYCYSKEEVEDSLKEAYDDDIDPNDLTVYEVKKVNVTIEPEEPEVEVVWGRQK